MPPLTTTTTTTTDLPVTGYMPMVNTLRTGASLSSARPPTIDFDDDGEIIQPSLAAGHNDMYQVTIDAIENGFLVTKRTGYRDVRYAATAPSEVIRIITSILTPPPNEHRSQGSSF